MNKIQCQVFLLDGIRVGRAEVVHRSPRKRFLLSVSRRLDPRLKRKLRHAYLAVTGRAAGVGPLNPVAARAQVAPDPPSESVAFRAGDLVKVRTADEIRDTLDPWGKLKGCRFMPEMLPYCGTVQRVLKPMERFFDECAYSVKRANGLVLLEGVMCQGVKDSGRCDRSCFYFWRQEWLEGVREDRDTSTTQAQGGRV